MKEHRLDREKLIKLIKEEITLFEEEELEIDPLEGESGEPEKTVTKTKEEKEEDKIEPLVTKAKEAIVASDRDMEVAKKEIIDLYNKAKDEVSKTTAFKVAKALYKAFKGELKTKEKAPGGDVTSMSGIPETISGLASMIWGARHPEDEKKSIERKYKKTFVLTALENFTSNSVEKLNKYLKEQSQESRFNLANDIGNVVDKKLNLVASDDPDTSSSAGRRGRGRRGQPYFLRAFRSKYMDKFKEKYGGVGEAAFKSFYADLDKKGIKIKKDRQFGKRHAAAYDKLHGSEGESGAKKEKISKAVADAILIPAKEKYQRAGGSDARFEIMRGAINKLEKVYGEKLPREDRIGYLKVIMGK